MHTARDKQKLLNRARRIKGQVEAIERALEEDKSCSETLLLIAAVRGAINGLMSEVIEDHIVNHVAAIDLSEDQRRDGSAELIDVMRSYLK